MDTRKRILLYLSALPLVFTHSLEARSRHKRDLQDLDNAADPEQRAQAILLLNYQQVEYRTLNEEICLYSADVWNHEVWVSPRRDTILTHLRPGGTRDNRIMAISGPIGDTIYPLSYGLVESNTYWYKNGVKAQFHPGNPYEETHVSIASRTTVLLPDELKDDLIAGPQLLHVWPYKCLEGQIRMPKTIMDLARTSERTLCEKQLRLVMCELGQSRQKLYIVMRVCKRYKKFKCVDGWLEPPPDSAAEELVSSVQGFYSSLPWVQWQKKLLFWVLSWVGIDGQLIEDIINGIMDAVKIVLDYIMRAWDILRNYWQMCIISYLVVRIWFGDTILTAGLAVALMVLLERMGMIQT